MSKIHVARQHQLGLETARTEVARIAARVQAKYGADYFWRGDVLHFQRSGVRGRIAIAADRMDLTVDLGLLLSAMKPQIEARLTRKIDEALAAYQA